MGACGGNYSAPSGVIYSPDFPDKYSSGRVCYWTIQIPGSSAILFNFTFFDISDQTDMVELLDGYTNQVVVRFDWRSPPREVVNITGDFVILYFYSDRTNQAQGFALLYQGEAWFLFAGFEFQPRILTTDPLQIPQPAAFSCSGACGFAGSAPQLCIPALAPTCRVGGETFSLFIC